jgi:hypothetical protein
VVRELPQLHLSLRRPRPARWRGCAGGRDRASLAVGLRLHGSLARHHRGRAAPVLRHAHLRRDLERQRVPAGPFLGQPRLHRGGRLLLAHRAERPHGARPRLRVVQPRLPRLTARVVRSMRQARGVHGDRLPLDCRRRHHAQRLVDLGPLRHGRTGIGLRGRVRGARRRDLVRRDVLVGLAGAAPGKRVER